MNNKLKELGMRNIKILIDRLVPFDSLANVSIYGNCFCPFHDDRNKPSAHCYADEDGVVKLWCFQEHRFYGSYDYLKIIKGIDPVKYLEKNFSDRDLDSVIKILEKNGSLFYGVEEDRTNEIHNCWVDSEECLETFLDNLYFGYYINEEIN